ncbi:MAG: hypothetical protein U0791_11295 [Gemmataceae bacterium]
MPIVLSPPGKRTPLPEQLASLGRSRRRVSLAAGVFSLVGFTAAAVLLAGFLDAWLHLSALARGGALVGTLSLAGGILLRRLIPAFRLSTQPLAIALELEELHPKLNDSLASAITFLGEGGPNRLAGLQSATVRRAERLSERHGIASLVPTGRCWRAFWFLALVACVAVPVGLWKKDRTLTALTRFADPFGVHPWPSKTRIELLSPQSVPARMPKGEAFELRFAVRGELPDRAAVHFHIAGGKEFEEIYPLAPVDFHSPASAPPGILAKDGPVAVVTAKFDPSRFTHNFQFRVAANDADTGWLKVEVLPPPRLVPLGGRASPQIHVTPPKYTGFRDFDLPDGAAVIEVPTGTAVNLRAASDARLHSAALAYLGDRTAIHAASPFAALGHRNPAAALGSTLLASAIGADIPLTLSGDGRVLHGSFTPSLSGMYALKLTDESGLQGSRLIEIRLSPDPVPAVVLLRPALGRDSPMLVPDAKLSVHMGADDKVFALRNAFLEYRVGKEGTLKRIAVADGFATVTGFVPRLHPVRREANFTLPVSRFLRDDGTPVRDGDTVILRAAADDWDDVSVLKEPGRSGEFELRIASKEAIEAVLVKELSEMRPDLMRAREQQRDAAAKTADAKPQTDGSLSPADREKLLGAEYSQRQVRGKVADPRDGLRAKAEMLRDLAKANNLPRSNATDRADAAAEELARLADRDLAAIEPLLGDARQLGAQPAPKAAMESPVPAMLNRAARHQKTVDDGLTGLIDMLSQWGDAGALRGDARLLRDAVVREAGNAEKLTEKVPAGKPPESLPADQRAELDKAAGKLDRLADQSNSLLGRAAKLAAEKDKLAADAQSAAKKKDAEADELRKKAAKLPQGTPERNGLEAQAAGVKEEAADLKAAGDRAQAEADALRQAVQNAGGQALPEDLRKAGEAMRANRQGESVSQDKSAAARLERFAESLAEQKTDDVPELAKKKKNLANQLDDIAGQQDELRKKAEAADKIADAGKREQELQKLAREQDKLVEQTRDLLQKLQRERADGAARDARKALDKMEAARDDLEQGKSPANEQKDATEKLDDARDKLDQAAARAPQELSDEKRRKLADLVAALHERQKGAVAEAERIQSKVLADKKWSRPVLQSYKDLEDRERSLAVEVAALAEREFKDLLVFARIVKDAAEAMEKAGDRVKIRRQDALDADPDTPFDVDLEKANASRAGRPMELALRRLEQVLEALKPENATAKKEREKKDGPMPNAGGGMPPMGGGGNGDVIPPLAQLKALRALQADLNSRTAEFDKLHPDRDKLSDEDKDDLKDLEDAQREIASLFEEMAKLFQMQEPPAEGKP